MADRRSPSWRASTTCISSGCSSQSRVDPSMSVKRNVTVPEGRPATNDCQLARGEPSRSRPIVAPPNEVTSASGATGVGRRRTPSRVGKGTGGPRWADREAATPRRAHRRWTPVSTPPAAAAETATAFFGRCRRVGRIGFGQRQEQLAARAPVRDAGLLAVLAHLDRRGAARARLAETAVHGEAFGRAFGRDPRRPVEVGPQHGRRRLDQARALADVEGADRRERDRSSHAHSTSDL